MTAGPGAGATASLRFPADALLPALPPGPTRARSGSRALSLSITQTSVFVVSLSVRLSLRRSLSFPHSSSISHSLNLSHVLSLSLVGMFDNYRNLLCVLHGSESQAAYTAYCDSDSSTGMLCGNRLLPAFVRASVGSHRGALSRQAGAGLPWRCGQC